MSRYSARSVATRSRSFHNALIVLATGTVALTESHTGRLLARIGDGYRSKVDPVVWSKRASAIAKLPKGGTLVQGGGGSRSMWEQWSRGDGGFDRREILRWLWDSTPGASVLWPSLGGEPTGVGPSQQPATPPTAGPPRAIRGAGGSVTRRRTAADLRLETSSPRTGPCASASPRPS
jgi:hypothetical protein